jgi:glyoxylase-like metal-dependent hydrolase (beta-lactamase superfamily II)
MEVQMSRLSETFELGALTIAALSDGAPDRALGGFFHGVDAAEWTSALGISDADEPVPFNFGTFLVRGDGHTTLIDTGLGEPAAAMGIPGGGELLQRLAEIGVAPDEIDSIVHTHLHGDHIGWNVTGEDGGDLTFPNAMIHLSQTELDHWMQPELADSDRGKAARRSVDAPQAAGRVATFDGEHAVTDTLTMVPTPGHTPGHCSVLLASQGEHLVILGDAGHHPVHLEHHDWIPGVDLDPAESTRSRAKIAALAVEKDAIVTGGHFPILTLGRLSRVESGYRWQAL